MKRRLRFWWLRQRARWSLAFAGSTIAEIDWVSGDVIRVPGFHPKRERSILWRVWATWRAGR